MSRMSLKARREQLFSVFVGHLHPDVEENELRNLFSGCGTVVDSCIMRSDGNSLHNYGFIRYKAAEDARRAVRELNGWPLKSKELIVDYSNDSRAKLCKDEAKGSLKTKGSKLGVQVITPGSVYSSDGYRPSCLDKLTNTARVKEACRLINAEAAADKLQVPLKMLSIMGKIENKGGAQKHTCEKKYLASSLTAYDLGVKEIAEELRKWETNDKEVASPITDTYLKKVADIRATMSKLLGTNISLPQNTSGGSTSPSQKNISSSLCSLSPHNRPTDKTKDEKNVKLFSPLTEENGPGIHRVTSLNSRKEASHNSISPQNGPSVRHDVTRDKDIVKVSSPLTDDEGTQRYNVSFLKDSSITSSPPGHRLTPQQDMPLVEKHVKLQSPLISEKNPKGMSLMSRIQALHLLRQKTLQKDIKFEQSSNINVKVTYDENANVQNKDKSPPQPVSSRDCQICTNQTDKTIKKSPSFQGGQTLHQSHSESTSPAKNYDTVSNEKKVSVTANLQTNPANTSSPSVSQDTGKIQHQRFQRATLSKNFQPTILNDIRSCQPLHNEEFDQFLESRDSCYKASSQCFSTKGLIGEELDGEIEDISESKEKHKQMATDLFLEMMSSS